MSDGISEETTNRLAWITNVHPHGKRSAYILHRTYLVCEDRPLEPITIVDDPLPFFAQFHSVSPRETFQVITPVELQAHLAVDPDALQSAIDLITMLDSHAPYVGPLHILRQPVSLKYHGSNALFTWLLAEKREVIRFAVATIAPSPR